jgi:hypothetical protein
MLCACDRQLVPAAHMHYVRLVAARTRYLQNLNDLLVQLQGRVYSEPARTNRVSAQSTSGACSSNAAASAVKPRPPSPCPRQIAQVFRGQGHCRYPALTALSTRMTRSWSLFRTFAATTAGLENARCKSTTGNALVSACPVSSSSDT